MDLKALSLRVILCILFIKLLGCTQASCPDDDEWEELDEKCVKFYKNKKDWISANNECKEKSGQLVTITTQEQQEKIQDLAKNGKYWIGAHIPALVFKTFFNRCRSGYSFRNTSCFEILPKKLSWENARGTCKEYGGKLAFIPDEETNQFVGGAMMKMADESGVYEIESEEVLSYWIDGTSDGTTLEFVDSDGNPIPYTNFMPSTVQNGPSCLEVFPDYRDSEYGIPELPNVEDQVLDATAAALEEARDSLAALGIPTDAIPQGTIRPNTTSNYENYDSNPYAPQYNIVDCIALRFAVCEFSLIKEENKTAQGENEAETESENDAVNKPVALRPSHVSSCKDLAILLIYSDKSIGPRENGKPVPQILSDFRNFGNQYYILEAGERPAENSSAKITQFVLKYCDLDALKSSLPTDDPSYSIQLYKWLHTDDDGEGQSILSLGFMDERDVYEGPCVLASKGDRTWKPTTCDRNSSFVCQYSKEATKKHFCREEDGQEKDWCLEENSLQELNEETENLLLSLQSSQKSANEPQQPARTASTLRAISLKAKSILSTMKRTETNRNGIKNLTNSVIKTASILMDSNSRLSSESEETSKSLIETINSLTEDVTDAMIRLYDPNVEGDNVTMLSVTSPGIYLRIYIVSNVTSNQSLGEYSNFNPDDDSIQLIMTEEQKNLSEKVGAAFINVQYKDLGRGMYTPRSVSEISNEYGIDDVLPDAAMLPVDNGMVETDRYSNGMTFKKLASNVMTATLRMNGTNYPTNVRYAMSKGNLTITKDMEVISESEMCVFMDNESTSSVSWSRQGCHRVYSDHITDKRIHCECNHTTDFAVLLLVFLPDIDILEGHREYIWGLSVVGHVLSIISLAICAGLFLVLKRELKSDRRVIHINLFFALLLANMVMVVSQTTNKNHIVSALDDTRLSGDDSSCIALTFFSHFFLLSAIFWMLVEGVVIYRKIVVVLSRQSKAFNNVYHLIGWFLPLVISLITVCVGVLTDVTYNTEGCWLSIRSGMIWSFAGPTILVVLTNTVILIMVLRVAIQSHKRKLARRAETKLTDKSNGLAYLKTAARGLIVLTPLLGVTWIFGLLMFHISMAYVFVCLNAFQGVAIFLCYCIFNPEVRTALNMKWRHYKAKRFTPMIDDKPLHVGEQGDNKTTGNWLKTRLFMRLSFSTTSSKPPLEKFNSVQNSSSNVDVAHDADLRELDEDVFQASSPEQSHSPAGARQSSASTRLTYLSQRSTSNSSFQELPPMIIPNILKKSKSKIRPMSSNERLRDMAVDMNKKRPSTADAVLSRNSTEKTFEIALPNHKSFDHENHENPTRTPSETSHSESEEDDIPKYISVVSNHTQQEESDVEEMACPELPSGIDNPALDLDDDVSYFNVTTLMPDGSIEIASAIGASSINISSTKGIPLRRISSQTCDLCCAEYYNMLSDDKPIQLYSNAWTRRMKPKKTIRSPKRTQERRNVTITRGEICISRCCPQCHPSGRRNINLTNVPKRRGLHTTKLDVVDLPVLSHDSKPSPTRPLSSESRDSGISPDDLDEYDIGNSVS